MSFNLWYIFMKSLAAVIFWPIYRLKVIGRENLPKGKGYIIAPNHTFALDPVFTILGIPTFKRVFVLGKEELFKIPLLTQLFNSVGAVAINRGAGDMKVLEKIIAKVKKGHPALIFPEGTRSKTGELLKFKSGAFVIAAQAEVDMVPCKIIYKKGKILPIRKAIVIYGEPLPASELIMDDGKSAANLRRCKTLLRERIEKLNY